MDISREPECAGLNKGKTMKPVLFIGANYAVLAGSAVPSESTIYAAMTARSCAAIEGKGSKASITGPNGEVTSFSVFPHPTSDIPELLSGGEIDVRRVFLGVKEPVCCDPHISDILEAVKGKAWIANMMNFPFPGTVHSLLTGLGVDESRINDELGAAYSSYYALMSLIDPDWASNSAPDIAAGRDPNDLTNIMVRHPGNFHFTQPAASNALGLAEESVRLWNDSREKTGVGARLHGSEIRAFAKLVMLTAGNIPSAIHGGVDRLGEATICEFVSGDERAEALYREGSAVLASLFGRHHTREEVLGIIPPWDVYLEKGGGKINASSSFSRDMRSLREGKRVPFEKQYALMAGIVRALGIQDSTPNLIELEAKANEMIASFV